MHCYFRLYFLSSQHILKTQQWSLPEVIHLTAKHKWNLEEGGYAYLNNDCSSHSGLAIHISNLGMAIIELQGHNLLMDLLQQISVSQTVITQTGVWSLSEQKNGKIAADQQFNIWTSFKIILLIAIAYTEKGISCHVFCILRLWGCY